MTAMNEDTTTKITRKRKSRSLSLKELARRAAKRTRAQRKLYYAGWESAVPAMPENLGLALRTLRKQTFFLTLPQMGAFLGVSRGTITNWERGIFPTPKHVYLALVLLRQSVHWRFADEQWRDWKITTGTYMGREISYLRNDRLEIGLEPRQLESFSRQLSLGASAQSIAAGLQKKVDELQRQNTELRRVFLSSGVTTELRSMHDRIGELFEAINTAEIIPLIAKSAAG